MARVVREHGLGVVADSFDPASLARELNALSEEDVMRYKEASHAASGQLCFETAAGRLLALIEQLVSRSRDREQAFA